MEKKEFITSEELKEYCKTTNFDYTNLVRYYERRGYFERIFRGIFHIRYPDEIKLGKFRYNHLELVAHGLKLKGIKNWYFSLHTALKLNNLTYEHFAVDEVINDRISREKPMRIMGYKFKFIKTSKPLFNFGITKNKKIRFSDSEKTILDFIYIWKSNGLPSEKISSDIAEWFVNISKDKIIKYSKHYPKSVRNVLGELIERKFS